LAAATAIFSSRPPLPLAGLRDAAGEADRHELGDPQLRELLDHPVEPRAFGDGAGDDHAGELRHFDLLEQPHGHRSLDRLDFSGPRLARVEHRDSVAGAEAEGPEGVARLLGREDGGVGDLLDEEAGHEKRILRGAGS